MILGDRQPRCLSVFVRTMFVGVMMIVHLVNTTFLMISVSPYFMFSVFYSNLSSFIVV